jgi:hypothetical protein
MAEVPFHYQPRGEGRSHAQIVQFGLDYLRLFHSMWRIRNSINFPDYDWRAHNSRIPLQRYWQRTRHKIIMEFTPPNVSTVDVGCGSSHILASLPHMVGVDMRFDKLNFMRRTNKRLLQANGCILPFPDDRSSAPSAPRSSSTSPTRAAAHRRARPRPQARRHPRARHARLRQLGVARHGVLL